MSPLQSLLQPMTTIPQLSHESAPAQQLSHESAPAPKLGQEAAQAPELSPDKAALFLMAFTILGEWAAYTTVAPPKTICYTFPAIVAEAGWLLALPVPPWLPVLEDP